MRYAHLLQAGARATSTKTKRAGAESGPALTLQHFILRAEFVNAYRKAVRATRPLPDSQTRRETLDFLRADLERLKYQDDLTSLRSHLSAFNRLVKQFVPSLGLSGLADGRTKLVGQKAKHPLL